MLKSLILAFAMFSKIPMVKVEWNEKNMRYMMCFFSFVGLFIGAIYFLLNFIFLQYFNPLSNINKNIELFSSSVFQIFFFSLVFTLIPLLITGGIHFDGFMDTIDALSSHASTERKLEILKDSHVGSFSVIAIVIYFLCEYVFFICFNIKIQSKSWDSFFDFFAFLLPFCSSFFISRLFSSLAVAIFPKAKNSGLVHTFSDNSAKRFTVIWDLFFLILTFAILILICSNRGIVICVISTLTFAYYFCMSKKNFGGITGDVAGWFVQMCEILCLAGFVII